MLHMKDAAPKDDDQVLKAMKVTAGFANNLNDYVNKYDKTTMQAFTDTIKSGVGSFTGETGTNTTTILKDDGNLTFSKFLGGMLKAGVLAAGVYGGTNYLLNSFTKGLSSD